MTCFLILWAPCHQQSSLVAVVHGGSRRGPFPVLCDLDQFPLFLSVSFDLVC